MSAPTINDRIAAERERKTAAMSDFSDRELRKISNSSTTEGRWSWLEISIADKILASRMEKVEAGK